MPGIFHVVLLLTATALVVNSHPLEGDVANVRGKRNADCYYTFTQFDGTSYYRTCTSFCFAQGKYPYCYYQQCSCTLTPGQLPTLPSHQPQGPAMPSATPAPLPPKRSLNPWDLPQSPLPNYGQGETICNAG